MVVGPLFLQDHIVDLFTVALLDKFLELCLIVAFLAPFQNIPDHRGKQLNSQFACPVQALIKINSA
ncbi:MAG: hypothetical protein BWY80_00815 [Firmicutes bacterium ADurb.Bin456]|nr:MAG: hypothetical protein BWY80_00815 [Firmicutes bacterium ADurb.Bin456]